MISNNVPKVRIDRRSDGAYFRTLEELKERIDAKYASYHSADRVEKFWAIKYQVAQTIYLENGGNQYKLPHGVMAPRNAAATRGA